MSMKFKGAAKPLTQLDWLEAVQAFDNPRITEAHLRTIVEVEAAGKPFNDLGTPTFLFEPHVFYGRLQKAGKKAILQKAVNLGLAYPAWKGPGTYPKTPALRWKQFQQAYALDPAIATESASWGMPQVMGYHYRIVGYDSAIQMVEAFADNARSHLLALVELVKNFGIADELAEFPKIEACMRFAERYNGKGYRKNAYHTKLQSAYKRWAARRMTGAPATSDDGILRIGDQGPQVEALQKMLDIRGYELKKNSKGNYDGIFGAQTRAAVLAWQADNDRPTDGTMDAVDMNQLAISPMRPISEERAEATKAEIAEVSPAVSKSDTIQKISVGTGIAMGGAEVAEQTGLLQNTSWTDKLDQTTGVFHSVKGALDAIGITMVINLIRDHPFIVGIVVCGVVYYFAGGIIKERINAYRTGAAAR